MTVVVRTVGDGPFQTEIDASGHRLTADEPLESGGHDSGPSPYDLLLSALGACIAMTVRLYAQKKGWGPVEVTVNLWHDRIHAADCAHCMTEEGRLDRIQSSVSVVGAISDEQRAELERVAKRCPVHKTLTSEIVMTGSGEGPAA